MFCAFDVLVIFVKKLSKMKIEAANKMIDDILSIVEKKGIDIAKLTPKLTELREFGLKEEDPLVTKAIRLTNEYINEFKAFDVEVQYEEDEDGSEYPLEITDVENLMYFLNLLKKSDHKINREEIKEYRTALKEKLY
jgi:hypothetical protein